MSFGPQIPAQSRFLSLINSAGASSFPGFQPLFDPFDPPGEFVKLSELGVLVEDVSGRQSPQSAIPGILIAFTQGWTTALYALIVYVIVQQVENHLLIPLIQRKAVEVPPALAILAVAALGLLFGVLGALIATPLMAVILVWVKMFYVQDVLGKSVEVK